jgi:hypothetical protein
MILIFDNLQAVLVPAEWVVREIYLNNGSMLGADPGFFKEGVQG